MDALNSLTIGWAIAILVAVSGGIAAARSLDEPFRKRREMLNKHDEEISELKKYAEEQTKTNKIILKTLNAMVNHEIDGNGIDRLKSVRDELQTAIIEKK